MNLIRPNETVTFGFLFKNSDIANLIVLRIKQDFKVDESNNVSFQLLSTWNSQYEGESGDMISCKKWQEEFALWMNHSVIKDCTRHWPMLKPRSIEKYLRESFLNFTKNESK